ncbi:FHA domain-containing protein [Laspinema olomoucense]|uniref:FHA domain-containing protein n=1 Tax=Laspinema olomoucense TaxID=3231600 RepID=UPI0021BA994D|nr:FHA domain-containing protein [Laspinema sp. D3d]MCT7973420.1 FHA domain-containing protein [Laspinema sp. D3d]
MNGFGLDPVPGQRRLSPDQTVLILRNGPQQQRQIPLTQIRILIGRNAPPHAQVDLDLSDCELGDPPMVSRRHALLQWQDGQLTLRDLGSRNGTTVNGEKLQSLPDQPYSERVVLQLGSRIKFGNLELEVINSHE